MGDIVAFISPCNDRLVVHRVVGCGEKEWLVRGDNAPEPDGWIPSARMLGRVTRVERDGRDVRLGLGVERIVVAFMSRRGWLGPRVARRRIIKSILGRLLS